MKTNVIRGYIHDKLELLCHDTYYRNASNSANFPYIVFDLQSYGNSNYSLYDFEVNVWGNGNVPQMEDLADLIEEEFEKEINLSDNGLLVFTWKSRGNIDDPNKELKRIMIKFDMKYYK